MGISLAIRLNPTETNQNWSAENIRAKTYSADSINLHDEAETLIAKLV